jgi:hypothetical protein
MCEFVVLMAVTTKRPIFWNVLRAVCYTFFASLKRPKRQYITKKIADIKIQI